MEAATQKHRSTTILWVFSLLTLFFLVPALVGYESLRFLGDQIAADGSMEMLSISFYNTLRWACLVMAVFFLMCSLFTWKRPNTSMNIICAFCGLPKKTLQAIPDFWHCIQRNLRLPAAEWVPLLLICIGGLIVRWLLIDQPMMHDESYSVVTWARSSLRFTISDYHLPNNHVFNSVLLNLIYHNFGNSPALMRFPALLSGLLLIPSVFMLGKRLYSYESGLLSAGLCAFAPMLISYSTNARGYAMLALFSVWMFLLGIYLCQHKNHFAWLLLILIAALSFFTLPITLYPFGILCVWIFLSVLFQKQGSEYGSPWCLLGCLIFCGISVIALTALLYLPILLNSGTDALFNNVFVQPLPTDIFFPTIRSRLTDNFHAFTDTVSPFIWLSIICGNLYAIMRNSRISRISVPIQAATVVWLVPVILYQRPNLWPRTQIYLLPLLILWGSGGLLNLIENFTKYLPRVRLAEKLLITVLIFIAAMPQFRLAAKRGLQSSPHEIAIQVVAQDDPQQVLFVVAPEDDAAIWYYADAYGLPPSVFDKQLPFTSVYVYVNSQNEAYQGARSVDEVLDQFGPGEVFMRRDSETLRMQEGDASLYHFDVYEHAVESAYGLLSK